MKKVLFAMSSYYLVTGIWPILHINSFMAVTGPKTDIWLVKMVGLLTISISIQIFAELKNRSAGLRLPVTAALSYLIIDTYYALNGTISKIYLADGLLHVGFLIALFIGLAKKSGE
jgi:hypothetical protein